MSTTTSAAPPGAQPAGGVVQRKSYLTLDQMLRPTTIFGATLVMLFVLAPIAILVIELGLQVITKNPAYRLDFMSVSGGPQIFDRNAVPPFEITGNFGAIGASITRMQTWERNVALTILFALAFAMTQGLLAIKDNLQGAFGKSAPDIGATIALLMVPLVWLIGTPVLAMAILVATLPLLVRDRAGKSPLWVAPAFAVVLVILVLTTRNNYLLWGTKSLVGYFRMLIHIVMSAGKDYGFILVEFIKVGFTFYLFSSPNKDGSCMLNVWLQSGWFSIWLEQVPFSKYGGSFFTPMSPTQIYVTYTIIMAVIVLLRETFRPGTKSSGNPLDAKKANPISVMDTMVSLGRYTLEAFLVYGAWMHFIKHPLAPILAILSGVLLVAFDMGWHEFIVNAMPGTAGLDLAKHYANVGDQVNIGPFKFFASNVELILVGLYIAVLYFSTMITWLTQPASTL